VAGESQGGGIALAAAALADGVAAALVDVPFLCNFERGMDVASTGPYLELTSYLGAHHDAVERVLQTLGYFDGVNLAKRVSSPVMFSAALMDTTCPPSTVFAAFNACASTRKELLTYRFNGHEGGRPTQWGVGAEFLAKVLVSVPA
jgi:cephalosporin-C deacetylase